MLTTQARLLEWQMEPGFLRSVRVNLPPAEVLYCTLTDSAVYYRPCSAQRQTSKSADGPQGDIDPLAEFADFEVRRWAEHGR